MIYMETVCDADVRPDENNPRAQASAKIDAPEDGICGMWGYRGGA